MVAWREEKGAWLGREGRSWREARGAWLQKGERKGCGYREGGERGVVRERGTGTWEGGTEYLVRGIKD